MAIFPRLPLLDSALAIAPSQPAYEDIALVCVQHLLETTGSLIEAFIEIGFAPGNIHILGKLYSTDSSVQERLRLLGVHVYESGSRFAWGQYSGQITDDIIAMWHGALTSGAFDHVRKIVVLDDGGSSIASVPHFLVGAIPIIGVEQTMSGITLNRTERPPIPFVGVGSSAAKVLIEPRIIQEELFQRVARRIPLNKGTAGVVGNGYIGRAVVKGLQEAGIEVYVYDKDDDQAYETDAKISTSLLDLYTSVDTVWGCTGTDHLHGQNLSPFLANDKVLISCSSKDSEFRSILDLLNEQSEKEFTNRLSDVVLLRPSSALYILGGGFPINFDGSSESAPAADIQLTRALLFSGVLQAANSSSEPGSCDELDLTPSEQIAIVCRWLELRPQRRAWYTSDILDVFTDEQSVRSHRSFFRNSAHSAFQHAIGL